MEWMMKIQPISPILGSLLGLILMKLKLKKQCIPHETMMDVVTNGFMIIVVTWKFAPAILNPMDHSISAPSIANCRRCEAYCNRKFNRKWICSMEK